MRARELGMRPIVRDATQSDHSTMHFCHPLSLVHPFHQRREGSRQPDTRIIPESGSPINRAMYITNCVFLASLVSEMRTRASLSLSLPVIKNFHSLRVWRKRFSCISSRLIKRPIMFSAPNAIIIDVWTPREAQRKPLSHILCVPKLISAGVRDMTDKLINDSHVWRSFSLDVITIRYRSEFN